MSDFPTFYSADLKEIIIFSLNYDPKDRPSFE